MTTVEFAELPETNTPVELIDGEVVAACSRIDMDQNIRSISIENWANSLFAGFERRHAQYR